MSTYDKLLELTNILIQENGFEGFSYADLAAKLGIRKASVHHYFPTKKDLGLAYCDKKTLDFLNLENEIKTLQSNREKLNAYLQIFSTGANKGQMCGVNAMLSDYNLFPPELQQAVVKLAQTELDIVTEILRQGKIAGEFKFDIQVKDMAIIVCNALKGALMLNRTPPHNSYNNIIASIMQMLA